MSALEPPLVDVRGLRVLGPSRRVVLDTLSLRVRPGERVGVIGESGAGKTTLALAALGILRPGLRRAAGSVRLAGRDVLDMSERDRRRLRRQHTAWLGQDPAAGLTPTLPVAGQVGELLADPRGSRREIPARLAAVGLPGDAEFAARLPHQLSGGQQQRLALARILASGPRLLVLDEPTSRLDPVTRAAVIGELHRLQHEYGFATLLISHDLDLIARLTDEVVVLREGRQVEAGPCHPTLRSPTHSYTRQLRDAHPDPQAVPTFPRAGQPAAQPTTRRDRLQVRGLCAAYGTRRVLTGVDVTVGAGEVLALVGGSGSGKTTLARCLVGLHPPTEGAVTIDGAVLPAAVADRTRQQRGLVQLVAQDPFSALHPRRSVLTTTARPLRLLHGLPRRTARAHAQEHLRQVGLAEELADRLPHQLSGGERQRVAIARALVADPRVLVCDEVTSALDPTVAAEILGRLHRLRHERDLAVVFITHDLALTAHFADTVAVLDHGTLAERGPTETILSQPRTETARLLAAATPSLTLTLAEAPPTASALDPDGKPS